MNHLRDSVIDCFYDFEDDEQLILELGKIINEKGSRAIQIILHVLTNLNLDPQQAKESWDEILLHRQKLTTDVGRNINLRTAICDYFYSNRSLSNPKVVEIMVFEKAVQASRYDRLTNLFNRRSLDEELIREMSSAKRHGQDLSLLFFDLDDFKIINDTFGHQAGDLVLKNVADIIINEKRTEDIAARYGGEELVVILPKTDKKIAMLVGERIRLAVERMKIEYDGRKIDVTISGGVASFPINAEETADLLSCADQALYTAKSIGKNNISPYSPNKRRYLRLSFIRDIHVSKLGFEDNRTIHTQTKNISVGGILFMNSYPLDFGTRIQLSVPIKNREPLLIIGSVVRLEFHSENSYEIGVSASLQEIDKRTRTELSKLLRQET